jgi:hypothetical protein
MTNDISQLKGGVNMAKKPTKNHITVYLPEKLKIWSSINRLYDFVESKIGNDPENKIYMTDIESVIILLMNLGVISFDVDETTDSEYTLMFSPHVEEDVERYYDRHEKRQNRLDSLRKKGR